MALEHYKQFLSREDAEYYEQEVRNWKFVDSIDWTKYIPINNETRVDRLIDSLEESNMINIPKELGGCILNIIDEDEFVRFIKNKYGYRYRFVSRYNYFYEPEIYIIREGV